MAKIPKKDMNLYPLVVAPKKNTVKKGALFAVAGAAAVVLLVGGYVGARVYVHTQENLVAEMQEKANDAELMEKINNANAVAADINTLRTAGNAYSEIRVKIDGSQEYCDNFSDDLVEKLVSCEDTVSPAKVQPRWRRSRGCPMTVRCFPLMRIRLTANMSPRSWRI